MKRRTAIGLVMLAAVGRGQRNVVPVSLAELCEWSDLIVDGRVVRVKAARKSTSGGVVTPVEVRVDGVLKGAAGIEVTVEELGGELDGVKTIFYNQVAPRLTERYVLFLKRTAEGNLRALGGLHGHYRVVEGKIKTYPAMPRILKAGFEGAPVEKLLGEVRAEVRAQGGR